MNVSLTKELEKLVGEKVSSGLYNNASEVVRDAIRRTFCEQVAIDIQEDTPELANLVRQGMAGRHVKHKKGDMKRILSRVKSELQK